MTDNARVATAATQKDGLKLDSLALIGIMGTESARAALLRHASGRVQRVTMGERVGSARVVAIGSEELFLQTGSSTRKLEMPSG